MGLRRCVKTFVPEPLCVKKFTAPTAAPQHMASLAAELQSLADLKAKGVLTEDEFTQAKAAVIRIHAQALGEPQQQPQPPQPPQPEPEAATVDGPPPAPDSDNEGNEDPVPDADEAAPHRDGDAPPAEDDDVSLPPTKVEAPAPGEEEDAPPAPEPEPAPAPGQVADAAPPTEDPDQEAGAEKKKGYNREHASTIDGANALLAKGHKVNLTSAKVDVLREALRLWPLGSDLVHIRCNTAKIDVVEAALALGIDRNHITLKTADRAVAEEAEAKGLLPEDRIRIRTKTGSVSLAEFRRRRTSKRAKLDADGAETHQERQPLGEIQDVRLPAQSLRHPS